MPRPVPSGTSQQLNENMELRSKRNSAASRKRAESRPLTLARRRDWRSQRTRSAVEAIQIPAGLSGLTVRAVVEDPVSVVGTVPTLRFADGQNRGALHIHIGTSCDLISPVKGNEADLFLPSPGVNVPRPAVYIEAISEAEIQRQPRSGLVLKLLGKVMTTLLLTPQIAVAINRLIRTHWTLGMRICLGDRKSRQRYGCKGAKPHDHVFHSGFPFPSRSTGKALPDMNVSTAVRFPEFCRRNVPRCRLFGIHANEGARPEGRALISLK